ncbi:MAG: hypothetical protein H6Q68_1646 [Firmicutes bacterium]|nr:hypothetical protein [Bacillota bacterium]
MKLSWVSLCSLPIYVLVYVWWLPWHLELMKKTYNRTIEQKEQNKQFDFSSLQNAQPAMKPLDNENNKDE